MDRGAWQAIVHGVARVRHDLVTKASPQQSESKVLVTSSCLPDSEDRKNLTLKVGDLHGDVEIYLFILFIFYFLFFLFVVNSVIH